MRNAIVVMSCIVVVFLAGLVHGSDLGTAIQDGADRVVSVQNVDGKWGWPINTPPTHTNVGGPIGLGLLSAYAQTSDADHLDSAKAFGNALVGLTSDWVGTYNPLFLVELENVTSDSSYGNQAKSFFDDLDRKSTRLNSSHIPLSRMPSSA